MAFNFKKFLAGINIVPKASTQSDSLGDVEVLNDGNIYFHDGVTNQALVGDSSSSVLTNKTIDADLNTITNIDNNEIKAAAGIVYSKLNLTNSIVNADINATAAIAYSKLNLTNSIVDADINASAAIARTKIAAGTADHVIINNGSGVLSSEATLAKVRGGSGQDNSGLTFPSTGTLATLAGTEVFTNKDIDGGTAANNRRITTPKDTLANLTALTRKEGTIVYATDTQFLYYDNGTVLTPLTSSTAVAASFLGNLTTSVASGAEVKLGTSGSLEYDTNSALSSGNYTVPVTGIYTVTASYGLSNLAVNGSSASIRFYKNGVISKTVVRTMDGGTASSNEFMAVNGSCSISATAGDVLTVFAYQDNATATARTLNNAFGAHTNLQFIQFNLIH